eukprot:4406791-Prymnesium_polylepis.1
MRGLIGQVYVAALRVFQTKAPRVAEAAGTGPRLLWWGVGLRVSPCVFPPVSAAGLVLSLPAVRCRPVASGTCT